MAKDSKLAEALKQQNEQPTLLKSLANSSVTKCNKIIRDFASSLSFLSTRAYNFVRKEFKNALPHINTIRKWQGKMDGSPGFNKSVIPTIQKKISDAAKRGKRLKFSLQVDGMHINSTLEADQSGNVYGFEDLGNFEDLGMPKSHDVNNTKIAKEAVVFLINAVNDRWKAPVAYYLVNGVNAEKLARLVEEVLYFLESNKIDVISLTFDGLGANISMVSYLGASLTDLENLKPYFFSLHGTKIHIIFDACHMLKLIRNQFGKFQNIYDNNNNETIQWNYLTELNNIQEKEGLRLGNKITKRHVYFWNEKMKVKLASQLCSKGVSDALIYLQSSSKYQWYFSKSSATANFLEIVNNCFDILNSRSLFDAYPFKRAISIKNAAEIFAYLESCIEYIKQLCYMGPNNEKVIHYNFKQICLSVN